MKTLRTLALFLGSRTLTLWLAGIFIMYYLTVAVWQGEAFATLIHVLSSGVLFRSLYVLFLLNLIVRIVSTGRDTWQQRTKFLLRLPLFAGLLISLISSFMSLNTRQNKQLIVGEGDILEIPWEQSLFRVVGIESALNKKTLRTGDSAFFDYEPGINLEDQTGMRTTVHPFPPTKVKSAFMHILNFGLGQAVELRRNQEVVEKREIALRLIPFGNVDSFTFEPHPYKFNISIQPNRIITKAKEKAQAYDLTNPLYHVEIVKGDALIASGDTMDSIDFEGNMSLHFIKVSDWVLLEVASDSFLMPFIIGLILILAGLIIYPFSYVVNRKIP